MAAVLQKHGLGDRRIFLGDGGDVAALSENDFDSVLSQPHASPWRLDSGEWGCRYAFTTPDAAPVVDGVIFVDAKSSGNSWLAQIRTIHSVQHGVAVVSADRIGFKVV